MNGSMIMPLPMRLKDPEKIKRVRKLKGFRPLFLFDNYYMISPSLVGLAIIAKEVIVKLGNPERLKINHQALNSMI